MVGIEIVAPNNGSLGAPGTSWIPSEFNSAQMEYRDDKGEFQKMFVCEGFKNGEKKLFDSNIKTSSIRLRKPNGYLACAMFRIYGY